MDSNEWRKQCLKKISIIQKELDELRECVKNGPKKTQPPLRTDEFEHDFIPHPYHVRRIEVHDDFVRTREGIEAFQEGLEEFIEKEEK